MPPSTPREVWVSQAMTDPNLVSGFVPDMYLADPERAVDAARRNEEGQALPAERFPAAFFEGSAPGGCPRDLQSLPPLFNAGDFWVVSEALAEVLRGVELGRTSLYPTRLLRSDRATPVPGDFLCLSFGERRRCFVPERSPLVQRAEGEADVWQLPLSVDDGDIAVSDAAPTRPDLWVDPRLANAFFLSDGLASALDGAGLARDLRLARCSVV